jgi:hypothetical protein
MRATRGLMASMGAGLSLILAGSLALSLVSALIAFHGWPGVQSQRTADERAVIAEVGPGRTVAAHAPALRLPDVPRRRPTPAPRQTAAPAAPATTTPRRSVAPPPVTRKSTVAKFAKHPPDPPQTTSVKVAEPSTPAKPDVLKATLAPAADTVKNLGTTLDTTVNRTGQAVSDLVSPVLPGVGKAVEATTAGVGDLLSKLTGIVSQLIGGVGAPPTAPAAPAPPADPAGTP